MQNTNHNTQAEENEIVHIDFSETPKRQKKESMVTRLVYSALMFVAGIIFISFNNAIFDVLGYIVGALMLVSGVTGVVSAFVSKSNSHVGALIIGVLEILFGIFCLVRPQTIANIAIYVFALISFISGVVMINFATKDKKNGFANWKAVLAFGIVLAVLGGVMLLFVRQSQAVIAVIVGIDFIVSAVLNVIAVLLR